jgi:hypothetical protein
MSVQSEPSQSRTAARVNAKLDKHLSAYVTAASAAGVGILALAQPAEARIVYTPTNTLVKDSVSIDLNQDGIADFAVGHFPGYSHSLLLDVNPLVTGNAIRGRTGEAGAGFFGVPVGPGGKFATQNSYLGHGVYMARFFQYSQSAFTGPWAGVTNRYLGFKFLIGGQTHFGWARLSVSNIQNVILTGYAYETTPNKSIIEGHTSESASNSTPSELFAPACESPSLGMLARGADGLVLWRRRESEGIAG